MSRGYRDITILHKKLEEDDANSTDYDKRLPVQATVCAYTLLLFFTFTLLKISTLHLMFRLVYMLILDKNILNKLKESETIRSFFMA